MIAPLAPSAPIHLGLESLLCRLRQISRLRDPELITRRLKIDLERLFARRELDLPDEVYEPRPDSYARRLLHRDPDHGFSVLAMTWAPGQGTALHDHAGLWGVECLIQGTMEVETYEKIETTDDGLYRFARRESRRSWAGEVDALVPPSEYHVIRNGQSEGVAVTLHVYGGELDRCSVYLPVAPLEEELYRRESRQLTYDEDLSDFAEPEAEIGRSI